MATVLNRTTKQLIPSANTPEYPAAQWIRNPDLSAVNGFPTKYWTISGDIVLLLNQTDRDAVDAAEAAQVASIEAAEAARVASRINVFSSAKGFVPASAGGATNFLRADGSWAAPVAGSAAVVAGKEATARAVNNTETNVLEVGPIVVTGSNRVRIQAYCEVVKDIGTTSRLGIVRIRRKVGAGVASADTLILECRTQLIGSASAPHNVAVCGVDAPAAGTYHYAIMGQNGAFSLTYEDKALVLEQVA